MKNHLPNISNIMPSIRGLNFWTLKQKIKDHTVQSKSTIQLFQRIDIIKWNESDTARINQRMLDMYLLFQPKTSPNIRFKSDSNQAKNRYIALHGRLHRTTGNMKSHSFVLQFMQVLEMILAHPETTLSDAITAKDTAGASHLLTTVNGNTYNNGFGVEAVSTDTNYGILAGTGTTTPTADDYSIETLIAHGIAAGNLYYGSTGCGGAVLVGSSCQLTILRTLGNNSGGAITIKEIVLVGRFYYSSSPSYHYNYTYARDAVDQQVADSETAIVTYTLQTTV